MRGRILIVDDEKDIVEAVSNILELEDYSVLKAYRGYDAIDSAFENNPDAVILDIKMPAMDGLETLTHLKENGFENPVIIISGHGDIQTAIEAVRLGAFDFLEKPLSQESLLLTLNNALSTTEKVDKAKPSGTSVIGKNTDFINCMNIAKRISRTSAPVLITGETGTGKEVMARYIHEHSGRKGQFVEVNCAAIPEDLIESELFGHTKGSFTGAVSDKEGKFVAADKGTIFLDEIGDMSLKTQAKVLRALQEKIIYPVGSNTPQLVNVRVISATNKTLEEEIKNENFREDLFYRLNVIEIKIPSLKDRQDDIPIFVDAFAEKAGSENGLEKVVFSEDAREFLKKREFKGNIRELKNLVERIVVITQKQEIDQDDVEQILNNNYRISSPAETIRKRLEEGEGDQGAKDLFTGEFESFLHIKTLKEFREKSEKAFLIEKLKENHFNMSRTASAIDTPRSNLYKKIDQYDIDVKELEKYYENKS